MATARMRKTDWSVDLEMVLPGQGKDQIFRLAEAVVDALRPYGVSVSPGEDRLGVRLTVEPAVEADEAITKGRRILERTLRTLRVKPGSLMRVEALTHQELERELERPNFPDLVGVSEVAAMLRVSRARVSELARARDFPQPAIRLAAGPFWLRASIAQFEGGWNRKPGWRSSRRVSTSVEATPA